MFTLLLFASNNPRESRVNVAPLCYFDFDNFLPLLIFVIKMISNKVILLIIMVK